MSPSPDIHNTAFEVYGLSHCRYDRCDTKDAAGVMEVLARESCKGGSVTIPHKESVVPHMARLSAAAQKIGAVNTITKEEDGLFSGDNTDWLGIKNRLEALEGVPDRGAVILLCGAGGTARAACYAFAEMQAARVLIYNRTASKAAGLAAEFGEIFEEVGDLKVALEGLEELHCVVNTLPGTSQFVLPSAESLARLRPVVLEASYIPRQTAFVQQAQEAGCPVIEGIEMLFEQGCSQVEIWTKKPAPRQEIAQALLDALFSAESTHPAHAMMTPYDCPPRTLVYEITSTSKRSDEA